MPAPRNRVFRAWTDPTELKKWWTIGEGWKTSSAEIDLRVGGKISIGNEPLGGGEVVIKGEFLIIEPPRKLVYTWLFPGSNPEASTITVEFRDLGPQTEVVVTHVGASKEMLLGAIAGWESALAGLWLFLEKASEESQQLTKRLNNNPSREGDERNRPLAQKFSKITQSFSIKASPGAVYDALMDSKKHAAFTASPARISGVVGGKFSASEGYIFGKNLSLVKGKRIVQEWSTTEWPKGYPPSHLEITLTKSKEGTVLKMVHSRVPAEQRDDYAEGWKSYYWEPLKAYFEAKS